MEIFQTFQQLLRLAFNQKNWTKTAQPIHFSNLFPWLFLSYCMLSCLIYVFFQATTIPEYSDCMYEFVTLTLDMFCATVIYTKRANIFAFIEKFEIEIEKRKQLFKVKVSQVNEKIHNHILGSVNPASKILYEKANLFTEKFTSILKKMFTCVTLPGVTVPYLILTFYLHLTTDLGDDAFYLPFKAW